MGAIGWLVGHLGLVASLLPLVGLALYGLVLGVPPLRARALSRLPRVVTHTVRVVVADPTDPAAVAAAVARLSELTAQGRWSPAPPAYRAQTTAEVGADGALRAQKVVLVATTYHLRRSRPAAEAGLAAYVRNLAGGPAPVAPPRSPAPPAPHRGAPAGHRPVVAVRRPPRAPRSGRASAARGKTASGTEPPDARTIPLVT